MYIQEKVWSIIFYSPLLTFHPSLFTQLRSHFSPNPRSPTTINHKASTNYYPPTTIHHQPFTIHQLYHGLNITPFSCSKFFIFSTASSIDISSRLCHHSFFYLCHSRAGGNPPQHRRSTSPATCHSLQIFTANFYKFSIKRVERASD